MPSRFQNDLFPTSGWEVLLSVHGQALTYTPFTGSPATLTGIVNLVDEGSKSQSDGRVTVREGLIVVRAADAPAPDMRDQFTFSGVTYAVTKITLREFVSFEVRSLAVERFGGRESHTQRG